MRPVHFLSSSLLTVTVALWLFTCANAMRLERRGGSASTLKSAIGHLKVEEQANAVLPPEDVLHHMPNFNGLELPPMTAAQRNNFNEVIRDPINHDQGYKIALSILTADRNKARTAQQQAQRALEESCFPNCLNGGLISKDKAAREEVHRLTEQISLHRAKYKDAIKPLPVEGQFGGLELPDMRPRERVAFDRVLEQEGETNPGAVHRMAYEAAKARARDLEPKLKRVMAGRNDPKTHPDMRVGLQEQIDALNSQRDAKLDLAWQHAAKVRAEEVKKKPSEYSVNGRKRQVSLYRNRRNSFR